MHKKSAKRKLRQHALVQATYCVFAACSASVSHLSAISMKKDLCGELRAASAKRMHSAAFSRNWSKLGKGASMSILHWISLSRGCRFRLFQELFQDQKRGALGGPPLPRAPGIARGFIGSKPSRCSFLRASLRARRMASAFSRTLLSEGFS